MAANQSGYNLWVLFNGSNRRVRGRSLNDKHFKCYWLFFPLKRGVNLVNTQDIMKLNSYSANTSNTRIISWLTKLLLVRHINEDPIHHRRRGEWTPLRQKLYKLAWMKSSELQPRSGAENKVRASEMAGHAKPDRTVDNVLERRVGLILNCLEFLMSLMRTKKSKSDTLQATPDLSAILPTTGIQRDPKIAHAEGP